jgi:hypothetical protein
MAELATTPPRITEVTLLKLAREIAVDIQPLETILEVHQIPFETWLEIKQSGRFLQLLNEAAEAWNTALNAQERVKLKAAAMLEEWLPELNNRMHDRNESLPAKIEGAKLVAKIAGVGERAAIEGSVGERFSVTINLGSDTQLKFDKALPVKVIEHEPTSG